MWINVRILVKIRIYILRYYILILILTLILILIHILIYILILVLIVILLFILILIRIELIENNTLGWDCKNLWILFWILKVRLNQLLLPKNSYTNLVLHFYYF